MSGLHFLGNLIAYHLCRFAVILFGIAILLGCACAEDGVAVPHLIRFSGTISTAPAGTVGVIFALYKDQTGGAPLWQEVQNLTIDVSGHYSAFLGARNATGIALEVFSTGEARWLGVQPEGQPEQPRVLLVSVPYALKASDAETLGGLPVSAFLRSDVSTTTAPAACVNTAAVHSAVNQAGSASESSGTIAGYLPVFIGATGDLGNSLIAQSGDFVGIGTATPATMLDVSGTNPTLRLDNYSNTIGDSPNFNFITARGSAAAPLATQSGDNLGQFAAAGYNGSAFPGSKIKVSFVATESWTPTANGTAMSFQTTTNGTTARIERMRIDNTGNVGIGTTTPTSTLTVAGTVAAAGAIQSSAGGFVFPDGTTQTTAAAGGVNSVTIGDPSVTVAGTLSSPAISVSNLGITDAKVHDVSVTKVVGAASTLASNTFTLPQTINVGTSGSVGLTVEADNTGLAPNAIFATTASGDPTANAIYAMVTDPFSAASAITAQTGGQGVPVYAISTNQSYQVAAIVGQVTSTSGVGVQGYSTATTGNTFGVIGQTLSPNGVAVMGSGVSETCTTTSGTTTCTPVPGSGIGGQFQTTLGGTVLLGQVVNASSTATNVFRVDSTGKGFFDGGTQTGGADFAESVEVEGDSATYSPGDLMVVDPSSDRQFKQVSEPYSTLVAGIYATKPGILATPHTMDDPRLATEIPLAMVGIVPCKVTAENGPIHRGDLLVSSSTPGHAMKGTDRNRMLGAVVGKALGPLDKGTGVIEVLVTLQ